MIVGLSAFSGYVVRTWVIPRAVQLACIGWEEDRRRISV